MSEATEKLRVMRDALASNALAGIRLRGVDWFAWATAGGNNTVLLTAETGVAEVFVTADQAYVLTDAIEAERLAAEELPPPYVVWQAPWQEPARRTAFLRELVAGGVVASDRPQGAEVALPAALAAASRSLVPDEVARYRSLGRDTAAALTATLAAARPEWTEQELAGHAAAALWRRGIHPALALVAGDRRLTAYRHPTPTAAPLGSRAMLVCCARRHGLFANLTRFVYFRAPTSAETRLKEAVARVEAAAWLASRPGVSLARAYADIVAAYADNGFAGEERKHHQGGPTGYLSRLEIAAPHSTSRIETFMAMAWNPSLSGTKMEDTILVDGPEVENLTYDPAWPSFQEQGRPRPDYLVRP